MPVDFLSDDQVSRFGRFAAAPSPGELEQFFRLDPQALTLARAKRAPANRLGWAVQWGCVRMLGVFPTEDLAVVPAAVVRFAAEQLDVEPGEFAGYGAWRQNRYEHAWEIRDAYGYREFPAAEDEVRAFLAARVWASLEGPRALFDRAVVWLVDNRVLHVHHALPLSVRHAAFPYRCLWRVVPAYVSGARPADRRPLHCRDSGRGPGIDEA
ncbi:DUF4158 domain-containing protein (plasmid) [Streptomyces sp. NBC_01232]|uniref:DUF4158 domain-containing protein n=1 Tax=Streptomyces sp. NBC_01232 TaxID=2903786 RepID=UPI002E121F28|nr:DUF4158 domain-containing protein [Streptomyces sp. NBC_01232]